MTSPHPVSRLAELTAFDCWRLLETAQVARVVWNAPDGLAVVPVNHLVADGALWFRTGDDTELAGAGPGVSVAVEVDSIDHRTRSGWSVVVRGVVQVVAPDLAPDRLVDLQPWPGGPRGTCVRVEPDEVSGRRVLPPATDPARGGA